MCGIAGIVALDGFDPALLISMTNLVKYRGPDGYGFAFFDVRTNSTGESYHNQEKLPALHRPSLGLGARRLAILDLSDSGNQPMQIDDGSFWITYNGEVYNYLEIRQELEARGHQFHTHTDTEVILRAYREWGPSCVQRFNGMWAFAIYDRQQRKLFCSRDRFGVKPFYYFATDSLMLFGSEIKQILQYPGMPRIANESIVLQYLDQGVQDHSESTFFENIRQLLPGCSLSVDLSKPALSVQSTSYWALAAPAGADLPEQQAIEQFLTQLQRSVNWRLRSDVPVGSCLSGGLDSSSIVMLASKFGRAKEFHSFSSCYDEASIDEREFIREVVSSSGVTPHYVFPQGDGFWDDLECLIWHQDEPVGGTSVYAQWCVMREARKQGIPVLLDGQGGDETLCGYRKFYFFYLWHLMKKADPRFLTEGVAWIRNSQGTIWSWQHAKRYITAPGGRNNSLHSRVCSPELMDRDYHVPKHDIGPGASLYERQIDDLRFWSIPALLHYEDRNSMAHSVETRVPMLDYELVQFAINCPPRFKLRDGWTKWILRQALRGTLPEAVRLRRSKLGFATPQDQWLRQDVRGKMRSVISDSGFRVGRILSQTKMRKQLEDFISNRAGCLNGLEAFRLLNLELWARVFHVS
jgi:asparagine synthase (glutamine-hydrolysing)